MAKGRARSRQGTRAVKPVAKQRDARGRFKGRTRGAAPKPSRGGDRGRGQGERAASGRSLARRVREVNAAVRTLGRERVRPGETVIGSTRRLTPTRRGFRALDDTLMAIQRSYGTKQAALFTFDLSLRYRNARGQFVKPPTLRGVTFPRLQEVRRQRRRGESMASAFRRVVETQVKAATFRAAQSAGDIAMISDLYDKANQHLERGNAKAAARAFKRIRKLRQLTVRLTVKRVEP